MLLKTENLNVYIGEQKILENININVNEGEIVAIMGPNGSGKTTLARAILNDRRLRKEGKIYFMNEDITNLDTSEISKKGIYLSFQFPPDIEYIKTRNFLKYILNNFNEEEIKKKGIEYGLPDDFLERGINYNFSGGERKKFELFLIDLLNPKLVIFDEIDSGLDIDSIIKVNEFIKKNKDKTFIIITHYTRIFQEILPDKVYILKRGKIVYEGKSDIIKEIEKNGYSDL